MLPRDPCTGHSWLAQAHLLIGRGKVKLRIQAHGWLLPRFPFPRPAPQGTPAALPYPILGALSRPRGAGHRLRGAGEGPAQKVLKTSYPQMQALAWGILGRFLARIPADEGRALRQSINA